MIRVFLIFLLLATAGFAPALAADPDPTTGWSGGAFAEATYAWLKKNHPGQELRPLSDGRQAETILLGRDDMDLPTPRNRSLGQSVADHAAGLKQTIDRHVPESLRHLGNLLQGGDRIPYADPKIYTRREAALLDWLLLQKDDSVAPHELLGQAILKANGSVEGGLALAWNLLRENWINAPTRNANILMSKLQDPTGEAHLHQGTGQFVLLPEKGAPDVWAHAGVGKQIFHKHLKRRFVFQITKRGDKFSSYYHYLGVMLLSNRLSEKYGNLAGRFGGKLGALVEASVFRMTSGLAREREKRIWNDKQAADAGARLQKLVRKNQAPSLGVLDSSFYLRPEKRFAGAYQLEKDGRPPAYFGSKIDRKFWAGPMSTEELKLRFEYADWIDPSILDSSILSSTPDGERMQAGLDLYRKSGKPDADLDELLRLHHDKINPLAGSKLRSDALTDYSLEREPNEWHLKKQFPQYDLDETRNRIDHLVDLIVANHAVPAACAQKFGLLGPK